MQFGVTGGVPASTVILDSSAGGRYSASQVDSAARRYTLGPSFEFPIVGPLSFESGFLYKRFGFDSTTVISPLFGPFVRTVTTTTGNTWEFPLLAKARWRISPRTHFVLSAGPVIRYAGGLHERGIRTITFTQPPPTRVTQETIDTRSPATFDRHVSLGGAAGAGVEFSSGAWRFTPGVRFTRWDTERTASIPSGSRLNRTQLDALLTIGYAPGDPTPRTAPHPGGSVEFGLLAGVPLLSNVEVEYMPAIFPRTIDAATRRFAAGAYVAWNISPRFSIEASFLARRFGHMETNDYSGFIYLQSVRGTLWEAPLLVRYRVLPHRAVTPVIGFGPALRRASNVEWWSGTPDTLFRLPGGPISRTAAGLAATAGIESQWGHLRLRPELRFTLFERRPYDLYTVRARDHSLLFVLGIGYSPAR